MSDDILKGIKEIAEYIGCSESTVNRMIAGQKIPVFRFGGQWRMRKSTWDGWVSSLQTAAVQQIAR
jgi:excisionase family DNA binding protein